jgi:hypothetical protein
LNGIPTVATGCNADADDAATPDPSNAHMPTTTMRAARALRLLRIIRISPLATAVRRNVVARRRTRYGEGE